MIIKISKNNWKSFLITLVLICCSGVIQFSYIWYKQSLIIASGLIGILFLCEGKKLKKRKLIVFVLMLLIVFLNFIVYPSNLSGHSGLALKYVLVFFIGELISIEELEFNYRKIIFWLAAISLICFTVFSIAPQVIVDRVPIINYWEHSTRYFLIYNFPGAGYQYSQLRNYGPFHEGGMFAVFLNISILLLMQKQELNKKDKVELLVLIAALLTTFSTAGLIVFFIIIGFKLIINKNYKTFLLIFLLLLLSVYIESKIGIISNKFKVTNKSFTGRLSEIPLFLNSFLKAPLLGIGYQNSSTFLGTEIQNGTNGVLSLFAQFGLIGAIPFIASNIRSIILLEKSKLLVFRNIIILFVFWMVEPTIFQPLFLVLLFLEPFNAPKSNMKVHKFYNKNFKCSKVKLRGGI